MRARILSSLYDYTNNYADTKSYDSNRGIAANTAAAFLGMGLDRLEGRNSLDGLKVEISEAEAQMIESMALSADEMSSLHKKDHPHFLDRLMERMVKTNMPSDSQEAAEIKIRLSDPVRNKKPPFSIRIFVSNMKRLSGKMSTVFLIQYGLIHVVTWRRPTKTLLVLVIYTCVCLWPHLVLAFPLLYVLCGLIIPAYLHRHPMDAPTIIPVKSRGQSLLHFLNESEESSLLTDALEEHSLLNEDTLLSQSSGSCRSLTMETQYEKIKEEQELQEPKKKDKVKFVTSQMSMIINMRDLQNLTTDLLNSMERGESLINELTSFKDERLTTFLFYIVIAVTWAVLFFGLYIPWRIIFIQSGWTALAICHPKAKKIFASFNEKNPKAPLKPSSPQPQNTAPEKPGVSSFFENFDRDDIIVDDQPEIRTIEVYELQTKDVFKRQWKFYGYAKGLFGYRDSGRTAGRLPKTVDDLSKVIPPRGWKYDVGNASNWMIDTRPQDFFKERSMDQSPYVFPQTSADGWIVDHLPVDQDTSMEFRRRRLYRKCYRYSRSLKEIDLI